MYRAQILSLKNGDIELGQFDTEAQARKAIATWRNENNKPSAAARIICKSQKRYFFV